MFSKLGHISEQNSSSLPAANAIPKVTSLPIISVSRTENIYGHTRFDLSIAKSSITFVELKERFAKHNISLDVDDSFIQAMQKGLGTGSCTLLCATLTEDDTSSMLKFNNLSTNEWRNLPKARARALTAYLALRLKQLEKEDLTSDQKEFLNVFNTIPVTIMTASSITGTSSGQVEAKDGQKFELSGIVGVRSTIACMKALCLEAVCSVYAKAFNLARPHSK